MGRSVALILAILAVGMLGGCFIIETKPQPDPIVLIDNRTPHTITITLQGLREDHPLRVLTVERERDVGFPIRDCLGEGAIATDPSGRALARVDQPLCGGDQWVFHQDGSTMFIQGSDASPSHT
jgi:hypothetical protein